MRLYIFRHGETVENRRGIVQGWYDSRLSNAGQKQSEIAANNFDKKIGAIFSSDLSRCLETAKYFRNKNPEVPFFIDWRLRERCYGDAQQTHKDLHDWEMFWASEKEVSIANAEPLNLYNYRLKSFLDDLTKYRNYNAVLIITHGGTINRIQYLRDTQNYKYHDYHQGDMIKINL